MTDATWKERREGGFVFDVTDEGEIIIEDDNGNINHLDFDLCENGNFIRRITRDEFDSDEDYLDDAWEYAAGY